MLWSLGEQSSRQQKCSGSIEGWIRVGSSNSWAPRASIRAQIWDELSIVLRTFGWRTRKSSNGCGMGDKFQGVRSCNYDLTLVQFIDSFRPFEGVRCCWARLAKVCITRVHARIPEFKPEDTDWCKKIFPCLKFPPHFFQAKWPAHAQPIGPD